MMPEKQKNPVPAFSPLLKQVPGLLHGFSTRQGGVSTAFVSDSSGCGDLNLGYTTQDTDANVRINRQRWLDAIGANPTFFRYALLRQEHSAIIRVVEDLSEAAEDFSRPGSLPGDGLVTNLPGVLLTIQTADCVPVLLADPVCRVAGAFHAGWRGTLACIVEQGVRMMQETFGTQPQNVLAAIGPSIGPASYVVGDELKRQFTAKWHNTTSLFQETCGPADEPQLTLNLWEANRLQLLHAGIPAGNIDLLGMDTAADTTRFFSYRKEHGHTGRMMSSIGLEH